MKRLALAIMVFARVIQAQHAAQAQHAMHKAAVKEPDGFKGLKFEASEEECRKLFDLAKAMPSPEQMGSMSPGELTKVTENYCGTQHYPEERLDLRECDVHLQQQGVDVSLVFTFRDDHFVKVWGSFYSDEYQEYKDQFLHAYGTPSGIRRRPIQNQAGATFAQEELTWTGKRVAVFLEKYEDTVDEGSFTLALRDEIALEEREHKDKYKDLLK